MLIELELLFYPFITIAETQHLLFLISKGKHVSSIDGMYNSQPHNNIW